MMDLQTPSADARRSCTVLTAQLQHKRRIRCANSVAYTFIRCQRAGRPSWIVKFWLRAWVTIQTSNIKAVGTINTVNQLFLLHFFKENQDLTGR